MPFQNTVMVMGNLSADPEVRYGSTSGKPVCTINVASNEVWTSRESNERQEHTEWHRVVLFGPQAENIGRYARKGDLIHIQGRLRTRSYEATVSDEVQLPSDVVGYRQDEGGGTEEVQTLKVTLPVTKYVTEIIGDRTQLLTPRSAHRDNGGMSRAESAQVPGAEDQEDGIPF